MSRLLLLSILLLWMCPRDNADPLPWPTPARVAVFFGTYAVVVAAVAVWSRTLARRVADRPLGSTLDRYNKATEIARYFVPVWFSVGIFALGWGHAVFDLLVWLDPSNVKHPPGSTETYWRLPALVVGTLPALIAWVGLWWAQYPADRALKEQSLVYYANEGLPIHAPPSLGTYLLEQLRLQMLLTLTPVLLIVLARDVLAVAWLVLDGDPLPRDIGDALIIPAAALIFVFAPELLRRVISTQPLPPHWPLRRRLEALCRRSGLKYRDILLWHTNSSMGNAMVMGLFPRVRYVFLSDLLLETMREDEIEAVFAHEIGHIVHRHMWWYVAFAAMLMLFTMGPLVLVLDMVPGLSVPANATDQVRLQAEAFQAQIVSVFGLGAFVVLFGYLSRRFERQADVYAARTMQRHHAEAAVVISHVNPDAETSGVFVHGLAGVTAGAAAGATATVAGPHLRQPRPGAQTFVGEYGAAVVGSALHRVAKVNNIPVAAREWLHGSIGSRIRYLHELSADSTRTAAFDKYMRRLYWTLAGMFVMLAVWCGMQNGLIPLPA